MDLAAGNHYDKLYIYFFLFSACLSLILQRLLNRFLNRRETLQYIQHYEKFKEMGTELLKFSMLN